MVLSVSFVLAIAAASAGIYKIAKLFAPVQNVQKNSIVSNETNMLARVERGPRPSPPVFLEDAKSKE